MTNTSVELQQWLLYKPFGRYVLSRERRFYHHCLKNIFGFYALQLGHNRINFLYGNKIANQYTLNNNIKSNLEQLPFANNSIDLIIIPHILEFNNNYIQILDECSRVLIPEGKLIITNFNSLSSLGIWHKHLHAIKSAQLIPLNTMKQQLQQLNFRLEGGCFLGYRPPLNNTKLLRRISFLDKVGNRWFPTLANSYALIASKEVISLTRILPTQQQNPAIAPNWRTAQAKIYNQYKGNIKCKI